MAELAKEKKERKGGNTQMPEMGNRSGNLISCFSMGGDGPEVLTQEL